ncbi:hypothetical protein PNH50_00395 [Leisingera aquaemixtae]|uniref:hypothetical protein n=1 Tax=Leisingera aquaemixtae TaxID=1396826 RepID=UPI00398456E8
MNISKQLSICAILLFGLSAPTSATSASATLELARKKDWVAEWSLYEEGSSCLGYTANEITGKMFGIQFIEGMGPFVMLRIPWASSLPKEASFLIHLEGRTYDFRGRAFGEAKPSGTMFLLPVEDLTRFSVLMQDIADGNRVIVSSLASNQSYSLAGSKVALDAFFECAKKIYTQD